MDCFVSLDSVRKDGSAVDVPLLGIGVSPRKLWSADDVVELSNKYKALTTKGF